MEQSPACGGSTGANQLNQAENHNDGCAGAEESAESADRASCVLILGGGFGGIYAAIELERALRSRPDVCITLVTRDNYFLFTPMLHEVAASDLEMNTIVNPLRKMLRRVKTFTGNIETINLERRCVAVTHGFDRHAHELSYDHLLIALGSSTNFFGLPGLQDVALTIKTLDDAMELRNRLITHLEEANSECAAGQRQPLLTFVVVGAGFAGVETLGGINDFVREAICFYPNLKLELVRTILISSEEFILPELGSKLGAYAQRKLAARGVEIITSTRVTAVRDGMVELSDGQTIRATTLIWAAGNAPNPLVAGLRNAAGASWLINIWLQRSFPEFGRWATAHRFLTARPADSIRRRLSMRFEKRDARHATSPQISLAARRSRFTFPHWAGSQQSAGEPVWRMSSASTSRGFLPGGFGAQSISSSFHGSRRRCELLSIGRSIFVSRRISHA